MIDLIVVIQAVVAGLILYRSSHESRAWDRAGFALLACSAGLMTIRRVTATLDRYAPLDRVLLPHLITWIMLAASICFALELIRRSTQLRSDKGREGLSGLAGLSRFMWPFALMFLMSASEFIPPPVPWNGEHIRVLTAEESLREAMHGTNTQAACEAVRRHSARGVDVLRVIAGSEGPDAKAALQKLRALAVRVNDAIAVHEQARLPKDLK